MPGPSSSAALAAFLLSLTLGAAPLAAQVSPVQAPVPVRAAPPPPADTLHTTLLTPDLALEAFGLPPVEPAAADSLRRGARCQRGALGTVCDLTLATASREACRSAALVGNFVVHFEAARARSRDGIVFRVHCAGHTTTGLSLWTLREVDFTVVTEPGASGSGVDRKQVVVLHGS